MNAAALEISGLRKHFGGIAAVDGCSFAVNEGSLTGVIGPNGSGKTTLLNLVSGYLKPDDGRIAFFGDRLARTSPTVTYRLGLSRTFQRARVFTSIAVRDNLFAAVPQRGWSAFKFGVEPETARRAEELLESFRLDRLADVDAGELSYGQQKLLEFATVLMARPRVLLLDEPTAGVNEVLIDMMTERIRALHDDGVTVAIVEHNMDFVMGLCDRVVVLDRGQMLYEGSPAEVQANPLVLDAYLGD